MSLLYCEFCEERTIHEDGECTNCYDGDIDPPTTPPPTPEEPYDPPITD